MKQSLAGHYHGNDIYPFIMSWEKIITRFRTMCPKAKTLQVLLFLKAFRRRALTRAFYSNENALCDNQYLKEMRNSKPLWIGAQLRCLKELLKISWIGRWPCLTFNWLANNSEGKLFILLSLFPGSAFQQLEMLWIAA